MTLQSTIEQAWDQRAELSPSTAPAAVRASLPNADPAVYVTTSLGITFPFNLVIGIPLYLAMSNLLYS